MLYEIAYAFGSMIKPFSIFTVLPRDRVSDRLLIRDISISSSLLVVEEDENAIDPLVLFSTENPSSNSGKKVNLILWLPL